jgi:O-methyltransferase
VLHKIKHATKLLLAPLIYRYPPSGIQPERLMYYLKTITETAFIPGPIVEIGSHLCGTSIIAYKMMRNLEINKRYICVDTFRGFIPDHFNSDISSGTPAKYRVLFADNSKGLVRRILRMHDCAAIQLLERDCTKITPADFPDGISLCLLDVDLSEAVYRGLQHIWPLINPGGRILIDDCPPNTVWKALDGLTTFCDEIGAPLLNPYGMGVIEKETVGGVPSFPKITDALCDRRH